MNRKELIEEISKRTGVKKTDVKNMMLSFTDIVGEKLGEGESVNITGLGTFYVSGRAEHISKDINTGLRKKMPKVTVLRIKFSDLLKKRVLSMS